MKKILFILLALFLFSCGRTEKARMEAFESMKPPIIVFAKSVPATIESGEKATIILIDKFGERVVFDEDDDIGPALIQSYNFRDTLINLK